MVEVLVSFARVRSAMRQMPKFLSARWVTTPPPVQNRA
jgi:hypothetical protein